MTRPDNDEYFLLGAAWASLRGDCRRSKVGALLVNGNPPRVVGTGYNGTRKPKERGCLDGACPRGLLDQSTFPPGGVFVQMTDAICTAKHAEENAITYRVGDAAGATLYITRQPCSACIGLASRFAVARIVWSEHADGIVDGDICP